MKKGVASGKPIAAIKETRHMGDKSPKNTAKTNKQKADHKAAPKSAAPKK